MTSRNNLRNTVYLNIMAGATATHISILHLTNKDGDVSSLQIEVLQHVVINLLHHTGPVGVTTVRTALMQQNALDDTYFLSLFSHIDDTTIGVASIVTLSQSNPPLIGVVLHFLLVLVFVEHLDRAATHSHSNDTHLFVWQLPHHRTTKIVGRPQLAVRTNDRTCSLVPIAKFTIGTREITCCQHLETWVNIANILRLPLGITLHVRLSETDVDIEVRIYFCFCSEDGHQHQSN